MFAVGHGARFFVGHATKFAVTQRHSNGPIMGSLKRTFYRSSINRQTNKRTDRQKDSAIVQSQLCSGCLLRLFEVKLITVMRSKLKLKNVNDCKQQIPHWSYRRVTPGCCSYVRGCVLAGVEQLYTGNLLTVVLQLARRIYSLVLEMADSI